uniref:EP1-like glycoprotein 3 n=1 Tax=Erigeron canadensis TaxID=72917 RepID=UPI001CB9CCBA|nr:EP1-like glycoprotein 3 [Erigeron canadensis]
MVWTTNTAGSSVVGTNLTDSGNLVLYDSNSQVVWQSFDHPTDCLLPGQPLFQGQKLIPSVSSTNWTAQKGMYALQVTDKGLFAYLDSNPPQAYFSYMVSRKNETKGKSYARWLNGSLDLLINSVEPSNPDYNISISLASSAQYMQLMPDGHLKVFEFQVNGWTEAGDLLTDSDFGECDYPLVCGRNSICSNKQQCSCPASSSPRIDYFRAVNYEESHLGCSEITPLTCNAIQDQVFIALENVKNFTSTADMEKVDMETCKRACLNNCSCKAALFQYDSNMLSGECYLPSELFTMAALRNNSPDRYVKAKAFIKVQQARTQKKKT